MGASDDSRSRWTGYLDIVATLAMIAASVGVIWTLFVGSFRDAPPVGALPETVPSAPISISGSQIKGNPSAPVAIVQFSEFQCPYCGDFAIGVLPQLTALLDSGKAFLAFRHLPLENIHPHARTAAIAAECAGSQGRFWPMHDALFQMQKEIAPSIFAPLAQRIGLTESTFQACLTTPEIGEKVDQQAAEARALGITGTPTFLIGQPLAGGRIQAVRRLRGIQPPEVFQAAIEAAIASR